MSQCDTLLNPLEANQFLSLKKEYESLPRLRSLVLDTQSSSLKAKKEYLSSFIPPSIHAQLKQGEFCLIDLNSFPCVPPYQRPDHLQSYIDYGWKIGRSAWPALWISLLTACQMGSRDQWLADGDWLIESLLTSAYPQLTDYMSK